MRFISQEAVLKEMERKHLCELLVLERLISEEKESDLRKTTQQLNKEQQQERLFELKVCAISYNFFSVVELSKDLSEIVAEGGKFLNWL